MDQAIRKRLNEIRQKQLESQPIHRSSTETTVAGEKSQFIAALVGVAIGIAIAVIAWSLMTANQGNSSPAQLQPPIYTSKIREANEQIEHLSARIDLMTDSISGLEERLARLTAASEHTLTTDPNTSSSQHREVPVHTGSDTAALMPETESIFVPTHRVTARVNLRPSPSVETLPITTLDNGVEVQYLREDGNWFYVDTKVHGKGWCASEYLSPLRESQ
jgi:hypothetical protein